MIQKIIALSVCFILIGLVAVAQPTFSLNNASGTYNVNQQIIAKTFVDDFTDITYFKLQIIWNPAGIDCSESGPLHIIRQNRFHVLLKICVGWENFPCRNISPRNRHVGFV